MVCTYPCVKGLRDGDEDVFIPPCPRVNEECSGRTIELHKGDQTVRCFRLDRFTLDVRRLLSTPRNGAHLRRLLDVRPDASSIQIDRVQSRALASYSTTSASAGQIIDVFGET